jgi:cystathionine beta-lyase family protein involved in aluminum resistance
LAAATEAPEVLLPATVVDQVAAAVVVVVHPLEGPQVRQAKVIVVPQVQFIQPVTMVAAAEAPVLPDADPLVVMVLVHPSQEPPLTSQVVVAVGIMVQVVLVGVVADK